MTFIEMENCFVSGNPGAPALPVYGVKLLLPAGESITSVEITTSNPITVFEGIDLDPVQAPIALSYVGPFLPTPKNTGIYNVNAKYPTDLTHDAQTQYMCGYSVGIFSISPVQYNPVTGEVSYFSSINVQVHTSPTSEAAVAHSIFYRGNEFDRLRLKGKVFNPELGGSYGPIIKNTDEPVIPYLLITTSALADYFNPLIDYKNSCGYFTEVITVSEIQSTYPGIDTPEKIRNCVIDYYENFSTSFVLLGADNEFLPHRGLYADMNGGSEVDLDVPGDIYFAALDGNWDTNNNGIYGENNSENDLMSEVLIGRAAVDSPTEAMNWVNKQLMYQTNPVSNELENALMVGEDLGWVTWGSDLKEEIHWGTPSTAGFPANFNVVTLYDTPSYTFSGMNDLRPLMNYGPNLLNHMGHASTTYMMKFNNGYVTDNNFTNNGVNHNFSIIYSQGCYCGAFDNRLTNPGQYTGDCISESFNNIANSAVCMITNSRYGWGNNSGTNGPSQYYDRQFFDALFAEDISLIGEVNQDSKEDNIPYLNNATLWCYYELNLFGDPTLDIWTAEPMIMDPVYMPSIFVGADEFVIETPGVAGALCAISDGEGLIGAAYSNQQGFAFIEFSDPVSTLDTLTVAVTAHNYMPYFDDLPVITPDMPYIIVDDVTINDTGTGDGDGAIDLGESGYFSVDFHNVGLVEATGVYAFINCDDGCINIENDSLYIGDISASTVINIAESFDFSAVSNIEDGHSFNIELTMCDALDSVWMQTFNFEVSAPIISVISVDIYDNENGRLNQGETADIDIIFGDAGTGELRNCAVTLMCDNDNIIVNSDISSIALIEPGQNVPLDQRFNITVSEDCPDNSIIPMYLQIEDEPGYCNQYIIEITVGTYFESFEAGISGWTHDNLTPGFYDNWNLTPIRNHTPGGSHSWYSGSASTFQYANLSDGALTSPPIQLPDDGRLVIWHFMDAETSTTYPSQAFDGGYVTISYNGIGFGQIYPIGGYPFIVRDGSIQGPFPAGTQIFSGRHDWRQEVFDLSLFPAGQVYFRFRFGSDGSVTGEGWYIDDVEMLPSAEINPPVSLEAYISLDEVNLWWNSPGSQSDNIKSLPGGRMTDDLLSYTIYRNSETIAEGIAALEYTDNLEEMPFGEYTYQVAAIYTEGASDLSNPVVVNYDGNGVSPETADIPVVYSLNQNYPNPFNPETTFKFGLPEDGMLEFSVFNITGQEVVKLIDGFKPAGYHTITWQASNLPSGIYIYRMSAGDFISSGKMLLLK